MRAFWTTVAALLALSGCVSHPVGPARSFATYEGKAATTAESALSAVQTVRLASATAARRHGFGPYLSVVVSEQEEAIAGVQGTFGSIQPPDERADDLRDELDALLSDALDHVTDVRIAARRGRLAALAAVARPLANDAGRLKRFTEEHGG
jgi:hypothetical protein